MRPTGSVTTGKLLELMKLQEFKCAMTGRALTPETASLDHMVPVSRGGQHVMDNVQVVHSEINGAKRTMLPEEFLALCAEVVEHSKKK